MTLGCTDIGNKKPEFVAKTQFLYKLVVNEIKKGIRPRGFNGSFNNPESCDFQSEFDLLNKILLPFFLYTFLPVNTF